MLRFHIVALAAFLVLPAHACDEAEVTAKRAAIEDLLREVARKDPFKGFDFAVALSKRKDELAGRKGDDHCRIYDELLDELRALQ